MSDRYLLEPAGNKPVGGIRERGMPIKRERRQGVGGGGGSKKTSRVEILKKQGKESIVIVKKVEDFFESFSTLCISGKQFMDNLIVLLFHLSF